MDERKEELHMAEDTQSDLIPAEETPAEADEMLDKTAEASDETSSEAEEAPAEAAGIADEGETSEEPSGEAEPAEQSADVPSLQPSAAPSDEITVPIRARKEKKRRLWLWVLIPAVLLLLGAGAVFGYFYFLHVPTADQVLMKEHKITLREGNTLLLKYDLYPANADPNLTWASSDPNVLTVDEIGRVTALSEGVSTVTAKAKSGATGYCYITVRPPVTDEERELIGTWDLFVFSDQGHIDYYYGSAYSLTFYDNKTGILKENGEEIAITWEFDEIIDGYNYYDVKIPGHRGAELSLNSNTGNGMSGSLTLKLSDTLLWVFLKK